MNEKLCFVNLLGEESDGYYRYELFFINQIENFEIIEDNNPCCLSTDIQPKTFNSIHTLKTKLKFDLIQNSCCFSFKHAELGIVALAWQNLDNEDEYPEDGRLFFKFGETLEEVEDKLAMKNILMIN